jgi:hypothetical protein
MARSYRKHAGSGWTTARSEKDDKVIYHRKARRIARNLIRSTEDFDALVFPVAREISNVYNWAKDGKFYYLKPNPDASERKHEIYRKLIRK